MLRQFLLAILLLSAYKGFSQTGKVCLDVPQAQRVADSLAALPLVRQEANAWRASSAYYLSSRDSARAADLRHLHALNVSTGRNNLQGTLLASSQADAIIWRQRARRRGLVNWLLAAGLGVLGYLAVTH